MTEKTCEQLIAEINALKDQLAIAQETLDAIHSGAVDALVISGQEGDQVFTLQGAQHPYRIIVEAMNEGALTINLDGDILYCNQHFSELLGIPLEKVIGASLDQFISPGNRRALGALLDNPQAVVKAEFLLVRGDGQPLPVILASNPLAKDYGVTGHCLVVTDLTEQKQVEEVLRGYAELNTQLTTEMHSGPNDLQKILLERASDLEQLNHELEAFNYSVSHDLRAPLRSIIGFAQILRRDHLKPDDDLALFYADKIIENVGDITGLLEALLSLSRFSRQSLDRRIVNPQEIVAKILEDFQIDAQNDRVQVRVGQLNKCLADPLLLKQVYVNLISNALKFSASRNPAEIEIGSERPQFAKAEDLPATIYYVRDNGIGLDLKKAVDLFGVFKRYHNASQYPGAGVGLAIVKRIINRHGGRIWVESGEDQGATFFFTLSPDKT